MLVLRQSTAIDIRMGPFVDATDGVTPETGVTLGAADQAEVLKENGAATTAMAGTFAAITGADGWYDYTVATGDVDTVGEVVFVVQDASVCLPVMVRAQVVEEAIYDALFDAGSAGSIWATATGFATPTNITAGTITTTTNLTNLPAITSNWLTAAGIAASALDGKGDWATSSGSSPQLLQTTTIATLASQTSFTLTAGSADNDTYNNQMAVITDQSTGTQKAIGLVSDYVGSTRTVTLDTDPGIFTMATGDTIDIIAIAGSSVGLQVDGSGYALLPTATQASIDAIEVDTGTTLQAELDAIQAAVITNAAGADIAADIIAVKAETAAIVADTNELQTDDVPGLIATLDAVVDTVKVDTAAILVDTGTTLDAKIDTIDTVVDNLNLGIIYGAAATGTLSTTQATSDLTGYTDDQLIGRVVIVTSGSAEGEGSDITDYANTNGTLTFTAMTTAMSDGDTFKIV